MLRVPRNGFYEANASTSLLEYRWHAVDARDERLVDLMAVANCEGSPLGPFPMEVLVWVGVRGYPGRRAEGNKVRIGVDACNNIIDGEGGIW